MNMCIGLISFFCKGIFWYSCSILLQVVKFVVVVNVLAFVIVVQEYFLVVGQVEGSVVGGVIVGNFNCIEKIGIFGFDYIVFIIK